MFTSRAEYRLLLREDNAHTRLARLAHRIGALDDSEFDAVDGVMCEADRLLAWLRQTTVGFDAVDEAQLGIGALKTPTTLEQLLRRPEIGLAQLLSHFGGPGREHARPAAVVEAAVAEVEVAVKYEGYIQRQREAVRRFERMERAQIPEAFDYANVAGLSLEAREKLIAVRPQSLGQAARISGITPAALSLLSVHLRRQA